MSSFEKHPYAKPREQLSGLARGSIRDQVSVRRSRVDDSTGSQDDDQRDDGSDEESLEPSPKDDGRTKRTRSKSRERRSGYILETVTDDSSPSTAYGLRRRPQEARSQPPVGNYADNRPRQITQRAVYSGDESQNYMAIGAAIVAAVLVVALVLYFSRSSTTDDGNVRVPKLSMAENFVKELKDLEAQSFGSQHSRLWSTVRSAIKSVFNRFSINGEGKLKKAVGERSPAVILFVAARRDGNSQATSSCLVTKLANITAFAFTTGKNYRPGFLDIDGSDFVSEDDRSESAKKLLENKLSGYLSGKRANPVVVLRNIHRLSSEAALLLHAYCDNENAPFKEAVYYLTIDCGDDQERNSSMDEEEAMAVTNADEKNWDRLAETCLRARWLESGSLSVDKIAPILSRIANNVVFVVSEPSVDC